MTKEHKIKRGLRKALIEKNPLSNVSQLHTYEVGWRLNTESYMLKLGSKQLNL